MLAAGLALRVGLRDKSSREEAARIAKVDLPAPYAGHSQDRQYLGVLKRVAKGDHYREQPRVAVFLRRSPLVLLPIAAQI